jgi:hypothetical protein
MTQLCKRTSFPWLGTLVIAAGATFAAISASLWEASAFLPALIVAATIDHRRSR